MEIKDYIHLYIGQEVITPDGRGKLVGLPWSIVGQDRVSVHFGKMVATKNSIDGGYNKTRNHGEYLIKPQHLTPIVSSEDMDDIHLPGGVQLILRKLSDMTEEEKVKLHNYMFPNGIGIKRSDAEKRCFIEYALDLQMSDLSNHSERVMSVITIHSITKMLNWIRKNSFDADDLIPAGLAIDKTSLI